MKTSEYLKIDTGITIEKKVGHARLYKSTPHYHNAHEVHYFLDGNITFFIGDQSYSAKKGDLLFIDTYEIHNPTYKLYDYEKILIMYRPSFTKLSPIFKFPDVFSILNNKHGGTRLISAPPELQNQVENILYDMIKAYSSNSHYKLTYLNLYLSLFLTILADYLENTEKVNDQTPLLDKKIKGIVTYINDNLECQLSLEKISNCFHMDKYYLCRFFKEHTGLSVIDYVNRKRILTAEKLITQNKHTITDIAFMVGFNNLTHFERIFKQYTGSTPRNYKVNSHQEIST